ncbi:undecaprenyldiphospho-muramoylpentapeptide beta-N-acetylglucosaminyltransferase [Akkermansia glycaniphila]|uniref:UDP-N-acetylglucosamine--N-acetylmuramyl-(pentapeptide) pyrophosphoryl-undecaprenol N-acetylglucosamine transferase n=1 Tax=Akkermansia glycaniphila TaxID=1679444 RepID=A0A1H6L855_9BACT|nr:undecaprenyldiphospho-muramoylpentapeptide beta-N-acetylglucosaminyltransferase [Akkermansia glycaniphila]MBT9448493.1 undecaprenyldiphospho-muramoylpentapeptide beta-N-acetylglucosaminyltransferase [Akkermansia glycaniphila]SEH81449.1 murg: undecaprenyldiphospho-muramoylpentapeptide beta-n-acetylglucosaminyltransferase [Akkermansia glycaniphila]
MSQTEPLTVVIACGGTGGHLFPGIAVAQELKRKGHRPILLISMKSVDAQASNKYEDLEFRPVEAIAMPRLASLKTFGFVWKLVRTWRSCRRILREVKADVVLGMGGFTSLPPVRAGYGLGLRTYVHDSNALPGKANRLTARWCDAVLLGVQEASHYFPKSECMVTGTPVRAELARSVNVVFAREAFGLDTIRPVVLSMGGSQGAKQLNTHVLEAARRDASVQYLLLAGTADYERVQKMAADLPHVKVLPFCSDMASAYAAADGVICRSGASSLTELAALGKAALLVPYPFAADDHQMHNARVYAAHGAARVNGQETLSPEVILSFVHEIVLNREAREEMESAARALSSDDAAQKIAHVLEHSTLS